MSDKNDADWAVSVTNCVNSSRAYIDNKMFLYSIDRMDMNQEAAVNTAKAMNQDEAVKTANKFELLKSFIDNIHGHASHYFLDEKAEEAEAASAVLANNMVTMTKPEFWSNLDKQLHYEFWENSPFFNTFMQLTGLMLNLNKPDWAEINSRLIELNIIITKFKTDAEAKQITGGGNGRKKRSLTHKRRKQQKKRVRKSMRH